MNPDTMIAAAGLFSLGIAALTGAVWDSPVLTAPLRVGRQHRTSGRHARAETARHLVR